VPDKNPFAADAAPSSPSKAWFDDKHEDWYSTAYWLRTGRNDSRRAYEKRVRALVSKGACEDFETAAEFLKTQAINDRARFESTNDWDWRSRLHPATWLNGERWTDEAKPAATKARRLYF
jgi:hypothetical protein